MKKIKKKTIIASSLLLSTSFILSSFSTLGMAATNETSIEENFSELNINDNEYELMSNYLNNMKPMSDKEIGNYLVENGYISREELIKIDNEYYNEISELEANEFESDGPVIFATPKYINGYNKYRTFTKNGKQHLYVYISGNNLYRIKQGIPLAAVLAAEIPSRILRLLSALTLWGTNSLIEETGTRYGIVLKFVKDVWVHQGATYTHRYYGWFYQT